MVYLEILGFFLSSVGLIALMVVRFKPRSIASCDICGIGMSADEGICDLCLERVGRRTYGPEEAKAANWHPVSIVKTP
jgi:hypothetical protein